METFLAFSNFGSLLSFLNIIIVGVVVFFTINRYAYIIDVVAYALSKTLIPIITSLFFASVFGSNISIGIGTIFIMFILNFLIGLVVIKIIEKVGSGFDYEAIISFIIVFAIVDSIVTGIFSFIIQAIL